MGQVHPCNNQQCPIETICDRQIYDTVSNCLFASAATMSGIRLFYWFQLHDKIGPIVINLSKVFADLIVFTIIFALLMGSFAVALVPLRIKNLADPPCDNLTAAPRMTLTSDEPPYDLKDLSFGFYVVEFFTMVVTLFWFMLNPERPEEYTTDKLDGVFAVILYATYAIIVIIILLNLLIAVMNTTITKVERRQDTYWKYTRTRIWTEFFGEHCALPMPFNVILVIRDTIRLTYIKIKKARESKGKCMSEERVSSELGLQRVASFPYYLS